MFAKIKPAAAEITRPLPGDAIVPKADVVMDRAFTLGATPEQVWPWFMQLGKNRAGWYFPRSFERFIPARRRGLWQIDPAMQNLEVGSVIDDWGGKNATFEVAILEPAHALVHKSTRGGMELSWAIVLNAEDGAKTRVQLRLRMAPVKRKWLANTGGGFFDALTVAGLEKGLNQRLARHGNMQP